MNFKNFRIALLLLATLATLAGCGGLTRSDTNVWLDGRAGTTSDTMAGKWTTAGGVGSNWGEGNFIQEGARFYGTLGSYYVDGAVSGEQIYMAMSSGKKVYYTARLTRAPDGSYAGRVMEGVIIDNTHAGEPFSLMSMKRVRN